MGLLRKLLGPYQTDPEEELRLEHSISELRRIVSYIVDASMCDSIRSFHKKMNGHRIPGPQRLNVMSPERRE